jgi:hypothetical protein
VSDLHEELNTALAAVEPGAAPVEAAMLTGRKIRNRRRAGLLAGAVAVVAAAVVGVPAFAHQEALPQPDAGHVRVTVNPPGPHSPAGLIASGLVGATPWNLSVKSPNSKNCEFSGAGLGLFGCGGLLGQASAADPIGFNGESAGNGANPVYVSFGEVWKGVVSARVALSDGTTLTLHPVEVDGSRFVAFATPAHLAVDSVTVYSRSGELAVAIPFNAQDGFPTFNAWLRPGQARPPLFSGAFGSGMTATAYVGPWGTCVEADNTGSCSLATGTLGITTLGTSEMGSTVSAVFGSAAESVSYLTITRKDGSTVRAAATAVGPQKFWAVPMSQAEQTGARWTAYDAAGKAVGSGSIEPG